MDFIEISRFIYWKQQSQKWIIVSFITSFIGVFLYPLWFVLVMEIVFLAVLFLIYRWAWNRIIRHGVNFYLSTTEEQRRQLERRFTDAERRRFLAVVLMAHRQREREGNE